MVPMDVVIIAALVGAVSAFVVSVFDRRWAARDDRERWGRSDRRHVYAQFLVACSEAKLGALFLSEIDPEAAYRRLEAAHVRRAELMLVASTEVREVADKLFYKAVNMPPASTERRTDEDAALDEALASLETKFTEIARRDLGY